MIPRPGALRVAFVANLATGLACLYLAAVVGGGARTGPARSDDLPYGDLLRLDRTGAVVWVIVALLGIIAAATANRTLLWASVAVWTTVAVIALVVVVSQGSMWGMSRPGDLALSLGLAIAAVVATLEPSSAPSSAPSSEPS